MGGSTVPSSEKLAMSLWVWYMVLCVEVVVCQHSRLLHIATIQEERKNFLQTLIVDR
jgi:hypothetical protein